MRLFRWSVWQITLSGDRETSARALTRRGAENLALRMDRAYRCQAGAELATARPVRYEARKR